MRITSFSISENKNMNIEPDGKESEDDHADSH